MQKKKMSWVFWVFLLRCLDSTLGPGLFNVSRIVRPYLRSTFKIFSICHSFEIFLIKTEKKKLEEYTGVSK